MDVRKTSRANLAGLLALPMLPCKIEQINCEPPHNKEETPLCYMDPRKLSTTGTQLLSILFGEWSYGWNAFGNVSESGCLQENYMMTCPRNHVCAHVLLINMHLNICISI